VAGIVAPLSSAQQITQLLLLLPLPPPLVLRLTYCSWLLVHAARKLPSRS
jgi:hypothetical protein